MSLVSPPDRIIDVSANDHYTEAPTTTTDAERSNKIMKFQIQRLGQSKRPLPLTGISNSLLLGKGLMSLYWRLAIPVLTHPASRPSRNSKIRLLEALCTDMARTPRNFEAKKTTFEGQIGFSSAQEWQIANRMTSDPPPQISESLDIFFRQGLI